MLTNNAIPGDPGPDPIIQATDGNFYGTTTTGGTFDQGTVFRMSPTGVTKVLFSFDETHGCQPQAGLIQGNDNNFYGTALCGKLGGGIVFKITPGGALTPLHNFDNAFPVNGQNPRAGLVLGTDGNLYGATSNGGTSGFGILFRMTKTGGGFTVLHNFDGTHGGNPDATPMQHTDGRIYGLTRIGGISATQSGVLYRLDVGLAPFVSLVNASGKVGTLVEILGNGFTGTSQVKFGSAPASFTVISNTYLTAIVPSGAITGLVAVTTPSRTLVSNKIFRVIPQITAFSPTSGPVGTSVTITGVSLKQTTKVTFGGVKATSFTVNSNTKVTATVPSGAKTGKITVTTPGGTATSSGTFTVSASTLTGHCVYSCGSTRCGELTGYCVGSVGGACRQAFDPIHCPVGQPFKRQGTECGVGVDLDRTCTP